MSTSVATRQGSRVEPERASRLAVLHEHPHWFGPLFRELDRRELPYLALGPGDAGFEIGRNSYPFRALFNRMSPSAFLRDGARGIFYTAHYLEHLERSGYRVVNGAAAFRVETSKALQLEILYRLGLPFPRTRVVHDPGAAPAAARDLSFPVVTKPNVGGSGAGVRRFDEPRDLDEAVAAGAIDAGIDGTLLVQEYIPPAGDRIIRVEVLDGRVLYAIRVHLDGDDFNLCPADICRDVTGERLDSGEGTRDSGIRVEAYEPPPRVAQEVLQIIDGAGMDLGGVEYVEDAGDGKRYYYDVNALSNFVADPVRVLGSDPTEALGDYLEEVLR